MKKRLKNWRSSWVLTESDGGADASEDEEQGGDELGDVCLNGGGAARVIETADCDSWHFLYSFLFQKIIRN